MFRLKNGLHYRDVLEWGVHIPSLMRFDALLCEGNSDLSDLLTQLCLVLRS